MSAWVITAVGPDRPGIVERLSGALLRPGSNVADSRMINLRGQFALILLADVPDDFVPEIRETLQRVAVELTLDISFHPASGFADPQATPAVGVPYRLRIFAMDQPGIVHQVTDVLQRSGVNVEELETRSQPSPQSGAPLFSLELRMTVPPSLAIRTLRAQLTAVCDALNCDLELEPNSQP